MDFRSISSKFSSPGARTAWGLLVLGILLRCWYFYDFSGAPTFALPIGADVGEYYARAREIMGGRFFPVFPDIHAPVYSFFLSGFFRVFGFDIPLLRGSQLALNFVSWVMLYRLLSRYGLPERVRLGFLAAGMLLPVPFFYHSELVSESLLLPEATAALWLVYFAENGSSRPRRAAAALGSGVALGVLNLTHPMTLLFSFAEAAYFLLRRNMRRRGALVALGILATVGTFCAVQSFHYGELRGIQANAAFNVYLGNNRGADGRCYLRPGAKWRKFHSEAECEAARRGVPVDAVWRGRIIDFWLEHPFRGMALWFRKALLAFSPSEYVSGSDLPELLYFTRVVFWGRFLTPAVFLLAGVGLWGILRRGGYRGYEHFLILFLALWAAQIVTVTSGRYRLLMLVPCFLFAAAGALAFDWRRFWYLPLAVVFVCALFTVTDYGGLRKETASLYAELAFRRGDLHQADELAAYVAHSRFDPDPVRMANLRGAIAEKLGDADAAKRHYLLASKLAPAEPQAWMNLANLAAASGEGSRAGELYRKALKLAPRSPQALYNYARFRFNCGEECEADIASALDSDPAGSAVWNLAGLSAMRRGDRRRAAECFGRAAAFASEETRELYLNNRRVALGNER